MFDLNKEGKVFSDRLSVSDFEEHSCFCECQSKNYDQEEIKGFVTYEEFMKIIDVTDTDGFLKFNSKFINNKTKNLI